MNKKLLKTLLVCIVLVLSVGALFACDKSNVADGDKKIIVQILDENGGVYKEIDAASVLEFRPEKEGYTGKIYLDKDCTFALKNADALKNGDKLYVKWTKNVYTVSFKDGDDVVKTERVEHGKSATAPEVSDTEYKCFDGWDKTFDNVTNDLVVTAKFTARKYTLKFVDADDNVLSANEVLPGASIEDYYFAVEIDNIPEPFGIGGWYDVSDATTLNEVKLPEMPARDVTYKLKLAILLSAIDANTKVIVPDTFTYGQKSAEFSVSGKTYDGINYSYEWIIVKNNKEYRETTLKPSLVLESVDAGTYDVTVKIVASKDGYDSVQNEVSAEDAFTIERAEITGIAVFGGTFTYGDENAKIKIDGLKDGDKVFYGTDGVSFSSEIVDFSKRDVGEYKYYVKVVRNENYNEFTSDVVTINVTKAAVTIRFSPNKKELVYGDDLPALTAYVGNEMIGTVEKENYFLKLGEIAFSEKAVNVGEYSVEVKGFTNDYYNDNNFNVTFLSSERITISRAKLVVKTLAAADVVYGDDLSEVGCEITGWKNGDEKTEYTLVPTTGYNKKSSVGSYSFSYGISGERIKYYDTETNVVSFNVTKRAAEIIINDVKDIVYGDKVPELSAIVNGLLDGDTLLYTLKTDYTEKAEPKVYSVFAEIDGEENANYEVSFKGKSFNVLKKSLTITLESLRVAAGKEYKKNAEELKIGGLVFGDTVTGYVTITKDEAGVYTSDDFDKTHLVFKENCYEATYDLKVEFVKVDFKIRFADEEVCYDGQNHSVAVTADDGTNYTITYGTKKGIYDLTVAPSYKNAGVYVTYFKVVDNSLDGSEYEGEIKLTVKKAEVEIKIGSYTMTYGDELPEFSYTATGLIEGDVLSGEARYSVDGIAGGNVGTYAVSVGGLFAGDNYTIIVVSGTLTINKKNVAVVWSVKDRYVFSPDGQEMPSATYDGIAARVTADREFKNAGTYTFTATDESGNYELTNNVLKNITIEKATYSAISHDALSGVYNPDKTLKDYALGEGFRWADASEKPVCTKTEYAAIYNADSDNYENFELNIAIVLQKAKVALKDGVVEFDYDGTSHEIKAVVTYNGVALDTSLYSLTYDGKASKTYTDAGTHACLIEISADNYAVPENTYLYVKVKGVKIGGTKYTIEDALKTAKSGDTIIVFSNTSFATYAIASAIYVGNEYRTVKSGVTLLMESDQDTSTKIGKPTYGSGSSRHVDKDESKIKNKLTINESTSLEVYGTILIQGLLGYGAQNGYQGHTSGNHSQIINNGTINFNNGAILDLRGYIKGTGSVEARSGATVYSPFVIRDFRGGTSSAGSYYSGVSPFSVFEMPNIQCQSKYLFGATHTAYMDLYAGGQHNNTTNKIIASKDAVFILKDSTAGVIKNYDRDNEKTTLTIFGNLELGDLSMDASSITVKMSKVRFPISWNYVINIGNGDATTITVENDYKIMTGAVVDVKKNAKVSITTGTVMVYETFKDVSYGGWVYPDKEPGKLYVEGIIDVIGKYKLADLSYGGISGKIHGINGGKVIIAKKASISHTSKEGYGESIFSFKETSSISLNATFVNGDGTMVAAAKNKTYSYNGAVWQ